MSEHTEIKGKCKFWHLPYEEKGSFSYCHHCNTALKEMSICLNQGICSDWIEVRCPKCDKAIWTAGLTNKDVYPEEKKNALGDSRILVYDNLKCTECGKLTNRFDCSSYSIDEKHKIQPRCSEKCEEKHFKRKQTGK